MGKKVSKKTVVSPKRRSKIRELAEESIESLESGETYEPGLEEIEEFGVEETESSDEVQDDVLSFSEKEAAFDIFVDFGNKVMDKGGIPRYTILRNNQHLSTVDHPYSWDTVQQEYGGGHYKVICRNAANGQFIKSQTRMVAEIPGQRPLKSRNQIADEGFEEQTHQPAQPSFMETMTFLKQMNSDSKREAESQSSSSTQAFAGMLTAMMQSQQSQAQQMQALMLEQSKFQAQMVQQQNQMMMQFMEKMNDKLEKTQSKPSGDIDPFKMIQMLQAERDNGFKLAKEMRDMANEMAEEKAELLSSGSEDGEEKSWISSLAKSLPGLLAASMQPQPVQAVPVPQPPRQQPQGTDIYGRPSLPPRRVSPQQQQQGRNEQPSRVSPAQTVKTVGSGDGSLASSVNQKPVPKTAQKTEGGPKVRTINGVSLKDAIQQVTLPILTNRLPTNADPRATGREVLQVLGQVQITREEVLANFTWDEIMGIVKQYSLDAYLPWLKEFYAEIQGTRIASGAVGMGTEGGPESRKVSGKPAKDQPQPTI